MFPSGSVTHPNRTELRVFPLVVHVDALGAKLLENLIEILDPVVDHEPRRARVEIVRRFGHRAPHGHSHLLWVVMLAPLERLAAPRLGVDAQVTPVPLALRVDISALEEHASDSRNPLHLMLPILGGVWPRAKICCRL